MPVESIKNLGTAVLADVLIPGADEESDEALYNRFLEEKNSPATSGNMSDYKRWAKEVAGVGDVKVIPIWNGPGTVKVIIIDSTKRAASTELIDNVYEHIEDVRPIGATVTIVSGKEKNINVTATVTLANGYNIGQVQIAFKELLINYFSSIAFRDTYVSYARIGNLLLETPGIGDYANLLINNSTANIILLDEEIPVLGTVSLEV
ncbi:MAG TPA: baseplate J/gp47 family protein [Ureibacillus sp.]|nr:baseplate J/gp47 family protein [Ureibacillus sp.]